MNSFNFYVPTKVIFGRGCARSIGEILSKNRVNTALVITDNGVRKASCVARIISVLDDTGIVYDIYDGVMQNPREENVFEALEMLNKHKHEAIVAVGGGSVIDTAKATLAILKENCDIHELYHREVAGTAPLPLIAIPTTAGTGSEVTRSAVITDARAKVKETIRGDALYPKVALVDPELTISLPKSITAYTGMDALTHALEAYISKNAHVMSDALAVEAIKLIMKNLKNAVYDGKNIEARSCMIAASTLAGMAFSISGLGMVHAMAEPLGGRFNIPHGVANSVLLPYCLEFNCEAVAEKLVALAKMIDLYSNNHGDPPPVQIAMGVVHSVRSLSSEIGIPHRLDNLEISDEEIRALIDDASRNGCLAANPRRVDRSDLERIFRMVLNAKS
ncbi:MAG: iron-containing alcohol dehydrogenase [Methanomassiliicoccales archaeon]